MEHLPQRSQDTAFANAPYHVVPDNVKGGWNVYDSSDPQEPQSHFDTREEAIRYAEAQCTSRGLGFTVEEHEAPRMG